MSCSNIKCENCRHWDNQTNQGDRFDDNPHWGACEEMKHSVGVSLTGTAEALDKVFIDDHLTTAENFGCIFFAPAVENITKTEMESYIDQIRTFTAKLHTKVGRSGSAETRKEVRELMNEISSVGEQLNSKLHRS